MPSILIVGAGPTGLTAAVELARRGIKSRIIDHKDKASTLSRAVGINPRSLELLEPSGVTPILLDKGCRMEHAHIHDGKGNTMGLIYANRIPHRYNFMLALPQDETETILQERLAAYGVQVEYGVRLERLELAGQQANVTLMQAGREVQERYDLVIGADGGHSVVRQSLGIPFDGFDYPNLWSIVDFESSDLPYAENEAHFFMRDHEHFVVLIRIGAHRFRSVSNTEKALPVIPGTFTVERILAENTFRISVRQASTYQKGCVYLAGDAAHIHSPAGGRGMNLGIEDAADLARRIAEGGLDGYTAARHPVGKSVLQFSETLVRIVSVQHPLLQGLRNLFLRAITRFPFIQQLFLPRFAGLR